jgi:hypothetical protein
VDLTLLASLGTGVLMGVVAGLTRIWVPLAFLLVGVDSLVASAT